MELEIVNKWQHYIIIVKEAETRFNLTSLTMWMSRWPMAKTIKGTANTCRRALPSQTSRLFHRRADPATTDLKPRRFCPTVVAPNYDLGMRRDIAKHFTFGTYLLNLLTLS